ncbi:YdcA family protein [Enterobacter cloacae]|uniref:hypothetical protein n=1 Tax=Enterobacter cloacae TaxID=550 RepID=UPI00387ED1D8
MKKLNLLLLVAGILFTVQAEAARGRKPCSGSKGGISHYTSDGRFVCNDGSLSQSRRFCSGYGDAGTRQQVQPSTLARKTQTKKVLTAKKQARNATDNGKPVSTPPRQPTCTPLYMANKPGFTHLPICPRK